MTLYRTTVPSGAGERLAEALDVGVDVVTFTSSSTVTNLVALLEGDVARLGGARVACIGRVTAESARKAGLNVHIIGPGLDGGWTRERDSCTLYARRVRRMSSFPENRMRALEGDT